MELECVWCNQTKGVEEFAKSQRAKRDIAVSEHRAQLLDVTNS